MTEAPTGQSGRLLGESPLHWRQIVAIALCVALNAIDGFDVLSISFASPGIAAEWGIDRAALGVVLSMELIGMAAGSVVLGQTADRIGRRPTALACLIIMSAGMLTTTQVGGIVELTLTRLLTGFGIGGMLATTNALVAEYASDRWRSAAITVMAAGYPMGAIAGGSIASALLAAGNWRDVFWLGAGMSAALIPLIPLLLPEPPDAIVRRNPPDALARVNRSLRALGHSLIRALPKLAPETRKAGARELFSPSLRSVTLLLTLAYFLHIMTFYFILKWVPKIVVDMGYSPSAAGGVLVWANVGGLLGSLLFAALSLRVALRGLVIGSMVAATVFVTWFGQGQSDLVSMSWAVALGGVFGNAGVVGLYALIAAMFPTQVRAGGTGFVIGVGRGGAALSPILAGLLFAAGLGLPVVAAMIASASLLAAIAVFALPKRHDVP